jgi:hypothetical protein
MAGALTAAIAAAFSGGVAPPVVPDDYFEYTTLLLPGNGTNGAQNNTFLDGSTNNFTITRNGNTTQGTFSPFSQTGWGNYFNGSTDWLTTGSSVAALGSGNWTVEFWVYPTTSGTDRIISDARTSSQGLLPTFYLNSANNIVFYINVTNVLTSSSTVSANVWTHIAFVKNSSTTTCYINGTARGTYSDSNTYLGNVTTFGASGFTVDSHSAKLTGYISNYRSVVGRAVYTSAFDPPTTPLTRTTGGTNPPQGTETSLLICQSNRFLDSNGPNTPASSPITITPSGSPSVVAFSPFNPTSSWSAATYGGSGYFDGNGDWLSVARNSNLLPAANTDFTFEAWVYLTATPGAEGAQVMGFGEYGLDSDWNMSVTSSLQLTVYIQPTATSFTNTTQALTLNSWNHVVATRSGTASNNFKLFVNGVGQSFSTNSTTVGVGSRNFTIGADQDGTESRLTGYISSLRVVNGTGVYTSNFTPPTAPLTAITNTSLLLNYTNAGITDATAKNDLETVGNAQISTTQSKWGGSSMSFDGTGDWLLIPDQPPQRIGTGNFTIEMWVYRNSSGTYGLAGKGTGTTGWLVSLNSSNQVVFTYGSSTITSSGTVSATTWTHIAVVREGTSTNQTKIYIGGTNDGTGTVSTDFNQTNSMYIGADRTGGSAANAYVQDVRITNYARYTANFTAPTAAFPTL